MLWAAVLSDNSDRGIQSQTGTETGEFLRNPETKMGFPIRIIRVDNGSEFVNDENRTEKKGRFQRIAESPGMQAGGRDPVHHGRMER